MECRNYQHIVAHRKKGDYSHSGQSVIAGCLLEFPVFEIEKPHPLDCHIKVPFYNTGGGDFGRSSENLRVNTVVTEYVVIALEEYVTAGFVYMPYLPYGSGAAAAMVHMRE